MARVHDGLRGNDRSTRRRRMRPGTSSRRITNGTRGWWWRPRLSTQWMTSICTIRPSMPTSARSSKPLAPPSSMKAVTEQSAVRCGRIARAATVARAVRFAARVADGRGGIRGDVRGVRSRIQLRRVLQADGGGVRRAAQRDLGGVLDHGAGVVRARATHGPSVGSLRPANRGRDAVRSSWALVSR